MPPSSVSVRPDARQGLGPGAVVGGRFEIERAVGEDALGTILAARDQKTQRPIAVRVLAPGLIATPAALETLRAEVKTAASIQHKNLVGTYGMGNDKSGARFVAAEWMDGRTLADVVREKKDSAQPMSLRGAYNVLAHVCKALDAARAAGASHGALRPSAVWIGKNGRVKVSGLGLDRAIVKTAGPTALGAAEQAFLAPEVKAGADPDTRSDVFGLGGLLYTMLTGRSAADDFVAPSQAHPEASPELDEVLLKCLSLDPAQRYATPLEVKEALVALAEGTKPSEDQGDFGVDVDLDVDIGSMPPPPSPAAAAPVPVPKAAAPKPPAKAAPAAKAAAAAAVPQVGARVAADESFRLPIQGPAPVMSAEVDLGDLLSKITENDAARWMVVKDNLDHGPFSGRELVQLILKGDVLGDHGLLNMDTGARRKVKEAPEFAEFVEQWKIKKAEADHKVALAKSEKRQKLGFVFYAAVLGGVLALGGAAVGIYFVTRPEATHEERAAADLADLYARGEIEITGTAGILPDPAPGTGGRRRRGRGGAGGASYEDAMNEVVNLGNAAEGGGSMARLSPQQVAGVMNSNINRLLPCVAREPNVGNVQIDLAIAGSGQVLGASVRNGSPAFQSCVAGRVRQIRFPSFAAPRMGATFRFSTN